jgi:hypothetical protein
MSAVSAEEAAKIVSDASLAGVDVCLLYSHDRDLLTKMMDQLEQTTQRGEVSREVLEASVLRILNYKKSMFPDASALVNPEERVKHMSVRELWAQKIIFPCYSVIDSKSYIQSGVGGLTFEGIQHPDYYTRMMQEYLAQNPEAIPPFMANNSPQETGARESPANPIRREETDVLAELARVLESAYPRGVPEEVVEEILSRAFDQP